MGFKQISVVLTPEDETEFESFLRSRADIQILIGSARTRDECFVEHFSAAPREHKFFIWNRAFKWGPSFGQVRDDAPVVERRGYYYVSNADSGPCLEYGRHSLDSRARMTGRIYWPGEDEAFGYDTDAFDDFYSSVAKWVRSVGWSKFFTLHREYYLPHAYAQYVTGTEPRSAPREAGRPALSEAVDMARRESAWVHAQSVIAASGLEIEPRRAHRSRPGPLEHWIPSDLTSPAPRVTSTTASKWQSPRLAGVLETCGLRAKDVAIVSAVGGPPEDTLAVILYEVKLDPSVTRGALHSIIGAVAGDAWTTRTFDHREVQWREADDWCAATWSWAGLVVSVGGRRDSVERAIPRLP